MEVNDKTGEVSTLPGVGARVVYGFGLDREKRDALLDKCPRKFDMTAADYMRLVVDAILDDRLTIQLPEGKAGVYDVRK